MDVKEREAVLAGKVISLAKGTLLLNMRFMAKALSHLPAVSYSGTLECSGLSMKYDPHYLLARYKQGERLPVHDCLHMLLHCVFRHWYVGSDIDRTLWNAAADIATEALIMKLGSSFCGNEREAEKGIVIMQLSQHVRPLTAEKIYAYMQHSGVTSETAAHWCEIFSADDHTHWYKDKEPEREYEPEEPVTVLGMGYPDETKQQDDNKDGSGGDDEGGDQPEENQDREPEPDDTTEEDGGTSLEDYLDMKRMQELDELEQLWEELSKEIQSDLENFDLGRGEDSRYLTQALEDVNRDRCDYTAFLRRFAVSGELMKPDPDEFDRSFYCYGLSLYGNVALIEPHEQREVRLIRDFVIAIDTSGSVSGLTVQRFLEKTYSILKSEESFFTKVNIYVIQCDTEVREAERITCSRDFERYMSTMEIKGLGGTDFRPVFEYVDGLRSSGELKGLKGLIYFTDGMGEYPSHPPTYDTAFVFLRSDYDSTAASEVPPWAIKLILEENDI